jgi:uncharacterized protein YgfB (UPF0149 family)
MAHGLQYADLAATLARLGARDEAAAYHGALCGALCRQTPAALDPLALLEDGNVRADEPAQAALKTLRDETASALADPEGRFAPLLPADDAALAERARSLGAWCEGFLHGLASQVRLELSDCSEEVREIIADFAQFTRAALDAGDDPETEENAYAELVEYIRVGAQLVFLELHPRPRDRAQTVH